MALLPIQTLGAREELGTGGSLYYLRHQDITVGSERVWIEVRDKDSGLVIEAQGADAGTGLRDQLSARADCAREPLLTGAGGRHGHDGQPERHPVSGDDL